MIFGSVCSGIEAASMAWKPLGWRAAFLSEIDGFPCELLAHHHPDVPNYGDITRFKEWSDAIIDVLVGGTPCQSFSVAGLRKGLDDPRGNLMLAYLAIAARYRPRWLVWENVPGVLSSNKGRDFGTFLGGLAELGYGFAYRVLDAQYFNLAQRRERVFVVGCLGNWRRAAAVLFERASLRGDTAPRRDTRQNVAASLTSGSHPNRHALDAHSHGSVTEDGGGRGVPLTLAIRGRAGESTLECREDGTANAILTPNGGRAGIGVGAVAIAIQERAVSENPDAGPGGLGVNTDGIAYTLESRPVPQAVGFAQNQKNEVREMSVSGALAKEPGMKQRTYVRHAMAVRRLTPRECERLQGFPDDYTLILRKGKLAADGPRYKALGNSMAVPVMQWIGRRIAAVDQIP